MDVLCLLQQHKPRARLLVCEIELVFGVCEEGGVEKTCFRRSSDVIKWKGGNNLWINPLIHFRQARRRNRLFIIANVYNVSSDGVF